MADLPLRLVIERLHEALALVLVDMRNDVEREVEDALQVARRHVEQDAETARCALEEPDVRHRRRELDVPHALAAHLGARHLDAALVADDPLVADPLVLAAVALPVTGRAEDALVEEPILFRPQRAVVDRLGLRHLTARPRADLVRRRQRDADRVELVYFKHFYSPDSRPLMLMPRSGEEYAAASSMNRISSSLSLSTSTDRPSDCSSWRM